MITFYRTKDCPGCSAIQDALREMVLAHDVVLVEKGTDRWLRLPEGTRPPVLVDDKETAQGSENIIRHLEKLKKLKALWEKFQSDACYCDEEENVE